MQKECPICKSQGITSNLRLCKINYTECVYICTNEICSYPGNCPWEYVTYNLFDDSDEEGNTSEEVERDVLNFAEKRKQIENTEEEIRNSVVAECIANLKDDLNKPTDICSTQFDGSTTQVSSDIVSCLDLNTDKVLEEPFKFELKYANNDNNKESISIETFGTICNNKKGVKNETKNESSGNDKQRLSGCVMTSPDDKMNSKFVPLKFIKMDNVDTSNFIPCATNKKITLKFLNQLKPIKCEIAKPPKEAKYEDINDLDNVTQSLVLCPVKQQELQNASKKGGSNIKVGLQDSDKEIKLKKFMKNKSRVQEVPLNIRDEIDLNFDTESLTLSPIKKKETMKLKPASQLTSCKKAADIINMYLEIADRKEQDVTEEQKEISGTQTNVDLKKFVKVCRLPCSQKSASQYSEFTFTNKGTRPKKNKKQIINEVDITQHNIELHANKNHCLPNLEEANIIVEEIASSEQIMTHLKTVEATMEENEKCGDQEVDDLLGEFLQNVDLADINQANLSTNCSDLTEWLDLL